ncbi:DNA -binding domain-containing protein [Sphingopyxis sp. 550A]
MAIAGGDWRDAGSYARLLGGDRRCFAWEWLRRTPAYVAAWRERQAPSPFGLIAFSDPDDDALTARPIWSRGIDAGVLQGSVVSGDGDDGGVDRFDFRRLDPLLTVLPGERDRAHILISDGLRSIRIDLLGNGGLREPLALAWRIAGVTCADPQITALTQFVALARHGRFSRTLHPVERRAARWTQMLRVHDAIAVGVSTREIVAGLFGVDTLQPRWRTDAASWRLRVQRLARGAGRCLAMGPGGWLGGGPV